VWTLEEASTLGHDFVAKLYGASETFFSFSLSLYISQQHATTHF
jgi:hypothetical protein